MAAANVFFADLLRAGHGLAAGQRDTTALALGLRRPVKPRKRRSKPTPTPAPLGPQAPRAVTQATAAPADPPATEHPLWRVAADVRQPAELIDEPAWLRALADQPIPEGCFASDARIRLPAPAPLVPPARLARFLRQQLARPQAGSEPDLAWLLRRWASGQAVDRLRRQPVLRWPHRVQLVVDQGIDVGPLWRDLDAVRAQLARLLGQRLRLLRCDESPHTLRDAAGRPAVLTNDGSPLLVLGAMPDVGAATAAQADAYAHAHHRDWLAWAAARQRQTGAAPLLIAPLPLRLLAPGASQAFGVALLDESRNLRVIPASAGTVVARVVNPSAAGPNAQTFARSPALSPALTAMLGLLAGISCVTPVLLRLVRRAVKRAGIAGADVGAELEFLRLPEVVGNASGCRVRSARHGAVLRALAGLVSDAAMLADLVWQVRGWLRALSPLLQAEHLQTLQQHLPQVLARHDPGADEMQRASQLWAWYAAALRREPQRSDLRGYVGWLVEHNPSMLTPALPGLQVAWVLAHPDRLADPAGLPPGIAPEHLAWLLPAGPPQALVLQGQGDSATAWLVPDAQAGPGALCRGLPGAAHFAVEALPLSGPMGEAPAEGSNIPSPADAVAPSPLARHRPGAAGVTLAASQLWRIHLGARGTETRQLDLEPFEPPAWAESVYREGETWFAMIAEPAAPSPRLLRWVPRRSFAVDAPGAADCLLPHGTWWDDAEYTAFIGADAKLRCPAWADAGHGSDTFGYWAAFSVGGVTQTMRFVPPGLFTMGSPEGETDRWDDERQHAVQLTRGCWLADTACTQALWQAVMGRSPSRFDDDPQGPVEQVSWDDIQNEFLPALARQAPGLDLRLPSEAEWEYAARSAGTATGSFSWGEGISTAQANYDGNYPLEDGEVKGEYRERTMPVKSFVPNALGLWQMHGNVWEWASDLLADYPDAEAVDPGGVPAPEGPKRTGRRVLRGGSWINFARYCRSAQRYAFAPSNAYGYFGFRLARGLPEVQAGRAEPAGLGGPAARRPGDGAPGPAARQRGRVISSDPRSTGSR